VLTKDQAVCIRTTDYSETSQVVTLFARGAGKIRAIAKGSKRPKSAFGGPLEVLSFGTIVFAASQRDRLATLTEFQAPPVRGALRRHLFALHSCLFAVELLNALTDDYDPHPALFDHVRELLQDLEEGKVGGARRDILLRLILFQLALLHEVGLRPILGACVNCKRPWAADWRAVYFSPSANGLVCRDCEMHFADKARLNLQAANCLSDVKRLATAEERTLDEIERVLIHYFTHLLGRPPKTAKIIFSA
jgi:DNA repair protein RecO (recombination protein O)